MSKSKTSPIATAAAGDAVRVIDAKTREEITHVIAADASAGKVTRYAVHDGNLVRDGDALKVIEEDRAIVIEATAPAGVDPVAVSSPAVTAAADR
ncbi:MAG: hypothetical protein FJ335_11945 [Sphingomonadales bacterium]|nr:hypothetical protein [Sphingomonadales bacterium]